MDRLNQKIGDQVEGKIEFLRESHNKHEQQKIGDYYLDN